MQTARRVPTGIDACRAGAGHALKISKHIDYLSVMPTTKVLPVKVSDDPRVMLRADLETAKQ